MAVNLLAPIQLVHELLPTLLAQDEAHILNVCSIFGLTPLRKAATYQTTKFGLVGLSAALRAEYGRELGVTALCPGFVRTALLDTFVLGGPNQRRPVVPAWLCTSPDKVARTAVRAIRAKKGTVVIGPVARLVWWATRLSPGLIDWLARQGWRGAKRRETRQQARESAQWTRSASAAGTGARRSHGRGCACHCGFTTAHL